MMKRVGKADELLAEFGNRFRPLTEVRQHLAARPEPDEALIAVLREYEDRGEKGYELTTRFFKWFKERFGSNYTIEGPERGSGDIELRTVFPDYPSDRPVDFVLRRRGKPVAVGFARYDTDRGGSQEDDRTGTYGNAATEVLRYADSHGIKLKVLFINDGPGLLLGSMWRDYSTLDKSHEGRVMVTTLKMLNERLTEDWLSS